VLFGCLLVILAAWILSPAAKGTTDEQKYRRMRREDIWSSRLHSLRRQLPGYLVRLLDFTNLEKYYATKAHVKEQALLATGYLTNASITITNLPVTANNELSCLDELGRRLRARNHVEFVFFYFRTNQAVVTCRSQDLASVRTAIETP
jgi:hypothetical protein